MKMYRLEERILFDGAAAIDVVEQLDKQHDSGDNSSDTSVDATANPDSVAPNDASVQADVSKASSGTSGGTGTGLTAELITAISAEAGHASSHSDSQLEEINSVISSLLNSSGNSLQAGDGDTIVVNSVRDVAFSQLKTDEVTLRYAIYEAELSAGSDTINFDNSILGKTIKLDSDLGTLNIQSSMTISNEASKTVTVSGVNEIQVFNINDHNPEITADVNITGLNIINGNSIGTDGKGGGIYNAEDLSLYNLTVSGNKAVSGGGIYNDTTGILNTSAVVIGKGSIKIVIPELFSTNLNASVANQAEYGGGIYNNGGDADLDSFTLVSGNKATGKIGSINVGNGGGIYNEYMDGGFDQLTIKNTSAIGQCTLNGSYKTSNGKASVTFTFSARSYGNTATVDGGGIYSNSALQIYNAVSVSGNRASSGDGGGIFVASNIHDTQDVSTLLLDSDNESIGALIGKSSDSLNKTVVYPDNIRLTVKLSISTTGNYAKYYGGGIYNASISETNSIKESFVSGNSAQYGAGVLNDAGYLSFNSDVVGKATSTVQFNDAFIGIVDGTVKTYANTASVSGGGILNAGTITISQSIISSNSAGSYGGGIASFDGGNTTVSLSEISSNSARYGSGISNLIAPDDTYGSSVTITNSTVTLNKGNYAIYTIDSESDVQANTVISYSTIARNKTTGVYNTGYGNTTVENSILAYNTRYDANGVTDLGTNAIGKSTSVTIAGSTFYQTGKSTIDAWTISSDTSTTYTLYLNTSLQSNGSSNIALSYSITTPTSLAVIVPGGSTPATDQRNWTRGDKRTSIGAYDYYAYLD